MTMIIIRFLALLVLPAATLAVSTSICAQATRVAPAENTRPAVQIEIRMLELPSADDPQALPVAIEEITRRIDPQRVRVVGGKAVNIPADGGKSGSSEVSLNYGPSQKCEPGHASMLMIELTAPETSSLVQHTKQDARSRVTQAPTITVEAGETANLLDGSWELFATAIENRDGEPAAQTNQPSTSAFAEGMHLSISTGEVQGEAVPLAINLSFSEIERIINVPLNVMDGRQPASLQYPVIKSRGIDLEMIATLGNSTLVVLGMEHDERVEKAVHVPGRNGGRGYFRRVAVEPQPNVSCLLARVVRAQRAR